MDFVLSKITRRIGTRALSTQAPVDYELPTEAVAEAIVNAVAHRDYASNASVQVMLFSDRLEIWNPGELPPPLTEERLRKPHQSIPRNPLIADPLFLARYIEKAGTGTLDMIARFKAAGRTEPVFEQDGGTFVQRMSRPKVARPAGRTADADAGSESRSESRTGWWRRRPEWGPESVRDRIMAAIEKRPLSRADLAKTLGHKSVSGALRRAVGDLMQQGLVAYTIPPKSRAAGCSATALCAEAARGQERDHGGERKIISHRDHRGVGSC